jgi:YesN/AraC family two-component response regulator
MSCLESKYKCIHAEDGEEGIGMAIKYQPDIVISDVMMPKKNGFEVCEDLKKNPATDHIPIILLTARVDVKDRITGFSYGADAYLTKPFSKPELFTRIDQLISIRKKLLEKLSKSGIDAFMRKKLMDPDALFLQKAIKHINENIDNTIFGPAFLAKKLLISESQLYRKLKAITGKSTALFIRSIRLQKAKELLQNEDLNISQVAYEVGFSNPSWFSTAFKEEFGYSPSEIL